MHGINYTLKWPTQFVIDCISVKLCSSCKSGNKIGCKKAFGLRSLPSHSYFSSQSIGTFSETWSEFWKWWHERTKRENKGLGLVGSGNGSLSVRYKTTEPNQLILAHSQTDSHEHMMTSSNGNILRVTGHLYGEFTGHRWIPHTMASDAELWCFLWSVPWINGWVNHREAGDLRRHRANYDVIVVKIRWHPGIKIQNASSILKCPWSLL